MKTSNRNFKKVVIPKFYLNGVGVDGPIEAEKFGVLTLLAEQEKYWTNLSENLEANQTQLGLGNVWFGNESERTGRITTYAYLQKIVGSKKVRVGVITNPHKDLEGLFQAQAVVFVPVKNLNIPDPKDMVW